MFSLTATPDGLYCPRGDFYIDPWRPVRRAVVTHAHSDHARPGSEQYLACDASRPLLSMRLGSQTDITTIGYGERLRVGDVTLSFHPAGHIRGSAQVRLEDRGHVTVVSGDYKRQADGTCRGFEPLRCHVFVSESTFGLPIYRWPDIQTVREQICKWQAENAARRKTSVLYAYAVGKAQRILDLLKNEPIPFYTHGAIERANAVYRAAGAELPATQLVTNLPRNTGWHQGLVIAPPSAHGSAWLKRLGTYSTAMVSGWMTVRGTRRRRSVDRGFIVSDHVDWPGLLETIEQTEADTIRLVHGFAEPTARYLREHGRDAQAMTLPARPAADDDTNADDDTGPDGNTEEDQDTRGELLDTDTLDTDMLDTDMLDTDMLDTDTSDEEPSL